MKYLQVLTNSLALPQIVFGYQKFLHQVPKYRIIINFKLVKKYPFLNLCSCVVNSKRLICSLKKMCEMFALKISIIPKNITELLYAQMRGKGLLFSFNNMRVLKKLNIFRMHIAQLLCWFIHHF